jgi:hypothetical protein
MLKGRRMARITKTMQALIERRNGAQSIACTGIRETNAARSLVALGMAREYVSQSRLVSGATYYNHFTRSYATRRSHADIGGILYFA